MFIYQLEHEYWKCNFEPSGFRIGYYKDLEEAEKVREHYLTLPGFIDHPEGFRITNHIINADDCTNVWVADLIFDEYMEDYIALGIFESKEKAEEYVEYYKNIRGIDVLEGQFFIEEYKLDKSAWQEGFETIYYNE
jgi:hypothetical protein